MAMLSLDMIREIQGIAEKYAIRERARLKAADEAAWEHIRVTDPARYAARNDRKFLVKTYYGDIGCTKTRTFETSTRALEYIREQMESNGPDPEYDYRYYAPSGARIELDLDWVPRVRCK